MRQEYLWLFIGMMFVTYIPRMLPYYLYDKLVIPTYIESALKILPYAAIGAFLIPGGITLYPETIHIAPVGLLVTTIITWVTSSIPLGVFSAVLTVLFLM